MDYFTENTKLVVTTEEGEKLEKTCESTKPDKQKFEAIRKAAEEGKASFKDVALYRVQKEYTAVKVELFYDEEKVGERKFPPVKIENHSLFEVTFELDLIRENGTVRIES